MKILYGVIYGKYIEIKKPKMSYLLEKILFAVSPKMKIKNLFKEREPIEILKIFGVIENI